MTPSIQSRSASPVPDSAPDTAAASPGFTPSQDASPARSRPVVPPAIGGRAGSASPPGGLSQAGRRQANAAALTGPGMIRQEAVANAEPAEDLPGYAAQPGEGETRLQAAGRFIPGEPVQQLVAGVPNYQVAPTIRRLPPAQQARNDDAIARIAVVEAGGMPPQEAIRELRQCREQSVGQVRARACVMLLNRNVPDKAALAADAIDCANDQQTKAAASIFAGETAPDRQTKVEHYGNALNWARQPQTRAKASLELGFLNDGDQRTRFTYAAEHATVPECRARAKTGLGLISEGAEALEYFQTALADAKTPATKLLCYANLKRLRPELNFGQSAVDCVRQIMAASNREAALEPLRSTIAAFPSLGLGNPAPPDYADSAPDMAALTRLMGSI